MHVAFCTRCGARIGERSAFCTQCGQRVVSRDVAPSGQPASAPTTSPAPTAAPTAPTSAGTSVAATVGRVQQTAGMAAAAAGAVGSLSLPWQTIERGGKADVSALVSAAAPSLLALAPRPNLRWPAAGIAFTVVMDVLITALTGQAINVPMLLMRTITGLGTSLFGALTGSKGGALRKVTAAASVAYAVVQLVSLLVSAYSVVATPTTLLALLPSIIAVCSGLYLSVTTAISGLKR